MNEAKVRGASKRELEKYLKEIKEPFEASDDVLSLRVKALRRVKRKRREEGRTDSAGVVFGAHTAYSLTELGAIAKDVRANGADCKRFEKVLFCLDDLADNMTTVKHLEGDCGGKIVDGKCSRCSTITPGEVAFKFELVVTDLRDRAFQMDMFGAKGMGNSLFPGKAARDVAAMDRSALDDLVDSWTEVPILAQGVLVYSTESDQVSIYPYQLRRLPNDYFGDASGVKVVWRGCAAALCAFSRVALAVCRSAAVPRSVLAPSDSGSGPSCPLCINYANYTRLRHITIYLLSYLHP